MACEHQSSREVVWLRSYAIGEARRCKGHDYCVLCGTVHVEGIDHGRPVEYFIDLLDRLQKYLEEHSWLGIPPLVEVEKRLLVQRMRSDELFSDPYGSYGSRQLQSFYRLVAGQRKELTKEVLADIIPT